MPLSGSQSTRKGMCCGALWMGAQLLLEWDEQYDSYAQSLLVVVVACGDDSLMGNGTDVSGEFLKPSDRLAGSATP